MPRSRAIDILRAVAVLLVLGRHMDRCPAAVSPALYSLTNHWQLGGWVGVDLFFVLSGYLVSGLLFREFAQRGEISAKNFLIRRGFKIYPTFWMMIAVTVTGLLLRHEPFKWLAVPCELLFVQNYGAALWNHTWSLAVEEHFYFGLALLFALLAKFRAGKNPFRLVPLLFAGLALTCLALRLWTWKCSGSFTDKVNFYPTHLRLDALGCGVTVAYWQHTHGAQFMAWARRWRWRLFVVGLLALAPAFAADLKQSPYNYTLGLTQFYLGSACLLVAMLAVELPENFLTRGLAYVGARSYSIYLWHMVWLEWIVPLVSGADKAGRNWPLYAATYLGGALAVGVALAALVELPGLRWRERWFPAR